MVRRGSGVRVPSSAFGYQNQIIFDPTWCSKQSSFGDTVDDCVRVAGEPGSYTLTSARTPWGVCQAWRSEEFILAYRETLSMLGLPAHITTCLFDLDGVLTQTAKIHAQAWKQMFDEFLRDWAERHGQPFEPFDRPTDYDEYVDGKPRLDGVRSFLESRGIELPMGSPSDPPDAETVHGLGTRKNELVLKLIREQGVEPYEGSVRFAEAARDRGLRRAVVSASTNCRDVLVAAGIEHL